MLYLNVKNWAHTIIGSNFPPELAKRFTFRMDSEMFLVGEDESTWRRHKSGKEHLHVMFDDTEIFEVPDGLDRTQAEWWILKGFRDAIANGEISVTRIPEHMSLDDVKQRKREKTREKKVKIEESIREAIANPMSENEINNRLQDATKKAKEAQKLVVEKDQIILP